MEDLARGPAIGLRWEGRGDGLRVVQRADSVWSREPAGGLAEYRGLSQFESHGAEGSTPLAVAIKGDRLHALEYLGRTAPGLFALVHLELPRTDLDDQALQFSAADPMPERVWLEVCEAHVSAARRLASPDGVVSVLCAEQDSGLARVLCDELLGRPNRIGGVVWQKAYAPRNMRGMKTLTAVHDVVQLYAVSPTLLRPVGLRDVDRKRANPDDDPRGPWVAEHKGAQSRRESTDFDAFRPPYRWRLTTGDLPPGIWRVNPMSGVMWARELAAAGTYRFEIEVTDSEGATAARAFEIVVHESHPGPGPAVPAGILHEVGDQEGPLGIETAEMPDGGVGRPYYATLAASGGDPYRGNPVRPRPPRFWEFSRQTFEKALAEDQVVFGLRGDAIASIKRYDAVGGSVENQTTWWPGRKVSSGRRPEVLAGYSQDARKHLLALQRAGLVESVPGSAKPEALVARLVDMFVPPGRPVLEASAESGELAAVAIKRGRPAFCLTGGDDRGRGYAETCVLPRLRAVIDGRDTDLADEDGTPISTEVYIPYEGGGRLLACEVGDLLATYDPAEELFELRMAPGPGLQEAVLTILGYLPDDGTLEGFPAGTNLDGSGRAVCLPPETFLTSDLGLRIAAAADLPVTIAYFRAEGLDSALFEAAGARFACVRIPYELSL